MLSQWVRVIDSDNGTLTDYSIKNQDPADNMTFDLVTTEDYIYIGKYYPFNNIFIKMGSTVNAVSSVLSVDYWDGTEWQAAVDVLDGTSSAGKTFGKTGIIQFSPNILYSWNKVEDTRNSGNKPTELSTLDLYHLYWIRLKVSATLTGTTSIDRLAYAFTVDERLAELDTRIDQYLTQFGVTDWYNQIMTASEILLSDFRRRRLVVHEGNILRFDDVSLACTYKALELIYAQLGPSHVERRDKAEAKYKELSNISGYTFDENQDGFVSPHEISGHVKQLVR